MRKHIAAGIDIGTHQVKVVISESDPGSDKLLPRILGTGTAESRGLRHGYIVNGRDTAKSVMQAVAQAERASGAKVKKAYLSMAE